MDTALFSAAEKKAKVKQNTTNEKRPPLPPPPLRILFSYICVYIHTCRRLFQVKEMIPDMELAQRCWVAVSRQDPAAAAGVLDTVKEKSMGPWYSSLCAQHPSLFPPDAALSAKMKETNDAEKNRILEVNVPTVCM